LTPSVSANQNNFQSIDQASAPVWERLHQRVEPRLKSINPDCDWRTGQKLFQPLVSVASGKAGAKAPKTARDEMDPKYIGEYLYKYGQMMGEKKQMVAQMMEKQREEESISQS